MLERKNLACLLVLALAGPGSAWAAEEAALLQLGVPVVRELHAGEVHSYRLPLEAGDYVRIEVVQEGVDVKVALRDPSGGKIGELDSSIGNYSTDVVSFVAEVSGEYGFEVEPLPANPAKRYRLTLVTLEPATQEDRERVVAERADQEAAPFINQGGPEGLEKARHAVEVWHALGDLRLEALALTRLGMIQFVSGLPKEALATCSRALETQRSLGDKEGAAASLNTIAKSNRALGDRERAFAAHEESITLWEGLEKPDGLARALLDAGDTYGLFGEPGAALASYERALALSHQIEIRHLETTALYDLGQLHMNLGQPRQALSELLSALDLAKTLARRKTEADVRARLGNLYRYLGRPRDAIENLAAALEIGRALSNQPIQCATLANLGSILFQLGSPDVSRELLLQALPLCLDPRSKALSLLILSRAEQQLGLSQDAAARLDEALKLQQSMSDISGQAETLRARGILFLETQKPAQARDQLLESVALFDKLGHSTSAVAAHRALARSEADLGQIDVARHGFEEALGQAQALDDVGEQALILAEAGNLEREAGRLQEARQRLESALGLFESFRSEIGGDRLRAQQFATVRETYERYADVLMQLDRSKADPELVAKAFATAERSRARGLLDVLARARIEVRDGNPELRNRELELRQELSAKVEARFNLPPGPRADTLRQEIQTLSAEQQIVEALVASESSYADLIQPPLTIPEAQGLLDDGTALLEYLLAEPRSYVWVVTRTSLTAYPLPGRSQIEALARQVHEALSNPSERDASGQRHAVDLLSRQLLAPALAGLDGKRLAIVADGALQYIPFAALPVSGEAGAPLLIAEHETVMLPSAAVLKEIRRVDAARPRSPLSLAIFADPLYRGSEPAPPTPLPTMPAALRGAGLERRLSWTRREAEQIAAEAEASGYEVLEAFGSAATRDLAVSDRLSRFRLIHFATHGFLDSDHPDLSRLALSEIDGNGRPLDGNLLLQDLYSLHLQADLVVLSGCETGLGRDVRGEGFLGLTHGFLHAGASQVIASLWPVRDRAAAELMQRLYHAMLRDGMRPAAALRAAQLEMRTQRAWRDPYFWAAFVAQGDWLAGADTADSADTPTAR
jgi:CHAT domain-containing protein